MQERKATKASTIFEKPVSPGGASMSLAGAEELSLNTAVPQSFRSSALRGVAAALCLALFATFCAPTISYFVVKNPFASALRYAIAVAQTVTLQAVFLHAPLALAVGRAPVTTGLAWYAAILLVVTLCYLVTGAAAIAASFQATTEEIVTLAFVSLSIVLALVTLVLTLCMRQSARGLRYKQKSFFRVNLLSWILAFIVAALTSAGLAVDYLHAQNGGVIFHFSQLVFLNAYYFADVPSAYSIVSIVFYVAALCAVPYTVTVMRLSLDQQIERQESWLNVLVLFAIICSQLVVFICSTVFIATDPRVADMDAAVVVLLLVTGIFVLRGIFYTLYVGIVVQKEGEGHGWVLCVCVSNLCQKSPEESEANKSEV